MPKERKPILILANPSSGGGLAGELAPHLVEFLAERGRPSEVFFSSAPGQITERAKEEGGGTTPWVVIGGDGTIREVLAASPGPDRPIAVLPTGSANVLATSLRLPKAPRETVRMIEAGRTRLLDAGRLRNREGTRDFLLMFGSGFDGRVVREVHEKRKGGTLGMFRYFGPILGNLYGFEPVRHWIRLEDGERRGPYDLVIVTNVRHFGGLWKFPEGIEPDDGLLDCLGFKAQNAWSLIRLGFRGGVGALREGIDLECHQAARIRIEAEKEEPTQCDGDPGPSLPVEITVLPSCFRAIVPPGGTNDA